MSIASKSASFESSRSTLARAPGRSTGVPSPLTCMIATIIQSP
ncbi:MAG TPA: hypothetical protein VIQ54_14065 [Polyangia bacterium]